MTYQRNVLWAASLLLLGCGGADVGRRVQAGQHQQGQHQQGTELIGGAGVVGVRYAGASRDGIALSNLRVERGGLKADLPNGPLGPLDFVGVELFAELSDGSTRAFTIEAAKPHPGVADGYLYRLKDVTGAPLCRQASSPGEPYPYHALPIAAVWSAGGDRMESTDLFTFACTAGVLNKCAGWGYTPWDDGAHDPLAMVELHQACTRAARADYCYDGSPHTRDNTQVYTWNNTYADVDAVDAPPGPDGDPLAEDDLGRPMAFEAAWLNKRLLCVSHLRQPDLASLCATPPPKWAVCDNAAQALALASPWDRVFFNKSVILPLPF